MKVQPRYRHDTTVNIFGRRVADYHRHHHHLPVCTLARLKKSPLNLARLPVVIYQEQNVREIHLRFFKVNFATFGTLPERAKKDFVRKKSLLMFGETGMCTFKVVPPPPRPCKIVCLMTPPPCLYNGLSPLVRTTCMLWFPSKTNQEGGI